MKRVATTRAQDFLQQEKSINFLYPKRYDRVKSPTVSATIVSGYRYVLTHKRAKRWLTFLTRIFVAVCMSST